MTKSEVIIEKVFIYIDMVIIILKVINELNSIPSLKPEVIIANLKSELTV